MFDRYRFRLAAPYSMRRTHIGEEARGAYVRLRRKPVHVLVPDMNNLSAWFDLTAIDVDPFQQAELFGQRCFTFDGAVAAGIVKAEDYESW